MTAPAILVEHVSKRFGAATVLEDVSFAVHPGEAVVLWGPNGAGKTTLLRCMLGVLPFDGAIHVQDADVRRQGKAARQAVGYVPQDIRFHADQSVAETADFYAALRGVCASRAETLLRRWDLWDSRHRAIRALSGGMRQKLALVIALLADPPILLLDEPASHLDVRTRRELNVELHRLHQDGRTLVFCTHRTGELWRLADRIVLLERGRLQADGTPEAVAGRLQGRAVVWVTVPGERTGQAAELLAQAGFAVERNGRQLWVGGPLGRRAEVIQRLLAAGIPVVDFDSEAGD